MSGESPDPATLQDEIETRARRVRELLLSDPINVEDEAPKPSLVGEGNSFAR